MVTVYSTATSPATENKHGLKAWGTGHGVLLVNHLIMNSDWAKDCDDGGLSSPHLYCTCLVWIRYQHDIMKGREDDPTESAREMKVSHH